MPRLNYVMYRRVRSLAFAYVKSYAPTVGQLNFSCQSPEKYDFLRQPTGAAKTLKTNCLLLKSRQWVWLDKYIVLDCGVTVLM